MLLPSRPQKTSGSNTAKSRLAPFHHPRFGGLDEESMTWNSLEISLSVAWMTTKAPVASRQFAPVIASRENSACCCAKIDHPRIRARGGSPTRCES
eukprot:7389016-Prymnesium_polylepis.1